MTFSAESVEQLNEKLTLLELSHQHAFNESEFESSDLSASMKIICSELLAKLRHYNPAIKEASTESSALQFVQAIQSLDPPFYLQTPHLNFILLDFLITELQAERLCAYARAGSSRRALAGSRGKMLYQLQRLCEHCDITPQANSEDGVLDEVIPILEQTIPSLPISAPILASVNLSSAQRSSIEAVNAQYIQDFTLRRSMLLQRLDVTIKSFLWGEKAIGREGEIVAAIQAQRECLTASPCTYTIEDALAAPLSLVYEHSKRVTEKSSQRSSLVKKVLIGRVPDRGGRAGEMRPSAKDIPFNKHGGNRGKHDHTRGTPLPPPQATTMTTTGRGGGEKNKGGGEGQKNQKKKQRSASDDKKSNSEKAAKKGRVVEVVLPK